jgi:CheY-like chemotaxis protein
MTQKVLIVDDDHIWLRLIKKKFENYSDTFTTLTALDGKEAVASLKNNMVSLVVTDMQMPEMDGLALLAHLSENFPDIPVIIMTAYSTPSSKKTVLDGGAAGYIEKPFVVEELANKIIKTLQKETEGGTLQTVPLDMFIQLIEMEQKTCTIRVFNKITENKGILFFNKGDLMDARINDRQGNTAAYEIFAWDSVTLAIQDECAIKQKRIEGELQAILFDAMRMKDEAAGAPEDFEEKPAAPKPPPAKKALPKKTPAKAAAPPKPAALSYPDLLRQKFKSAAGTTDSLDDIYVDESWFELLEHAKLVAPLFSAGSLKLCFINRGERLNLIILPGDEPTVVAVTADCPRDQVLEALRTS